MSNAKAIALAAALFCAAGTAAAEKHWHLRGSSGGAQLPHSQLGDSWALIADTAQGNYLHPTARTGGYACEIDPHTNPLAWTNEPRATEAEAQRDCVRYAATQDRRWKAIEDQLSWTYGDVWAVLNSDQPCDCSSVPSASAMPLWGLAALAGGIGFAAKRPRAI